MKSSHIDTLSGYMEALRPLIYINHFDFEAVDKIISKTVRNTKIYEFNNASGYVNFSSKNQEGDYNLNQFLALFDTESSQNCCIVLKDIHNYLKVPEILARLKSIALKTMYNENYSITIFIVSTCLVIPAELDKFITIYDLPYPDLIEIKELIKSYAKVLKIVINEEVVDELTISFKGLSEFEIRQILNLAYQETGTIDENDKKLILKEKEQIIKKSGMLEIVKVKENIEQVGGLGNLKKYISTKSKIFNNLGEANKYGVDSPKGILIVGMPGCGKSLTAKVIAQLFETPLLRLDVGKLMGKYVGESEENLRKAISVAEAVSPCVLWIDELEKAFAGIGGIGGGSDITTRLLGNFLTWLQEKESSVYVVATSNDISKLPAEFLRKGRFDELFFVKLPNAIERKQIFEIHLKKRNKFNKGIDTIKLIKETEGYSGADIESVVKDAIEESFVTEKDGVTTESLIEIIKKTKSISVTLKAKIEEIENNLEKFDFQLATNSENENFNIDLKTIESPKTLKTVNVPGFFGLQ